MKYKKQIVVGVVALLLVSVFILIVNHSSKKVLDLPEIQENGRLSVLIQSNSTGLNVEGGKVSGFQYDIVKAFADTLGLELVVTEENDLKKCIKDLNDGNYDIIAHLIPITTEWKSNVLFTKPLSTGRQVVVQRITSDSVNFTVIDKHVLLANESIYVTKNSPYIMRLQNLSEEIASPINIVETEDLSSEDLVKKVALGEIKYCICEEKLANRLKQQYLNIDVTLAIGFEQEQAWAVNHQSTKLLEKINEFLTNFIGSAAYWKIYKRYYN